MLNKRNLQVSTYTTDPISYRGPADSSEMNYILNSLKINANNCILRTRQTSKKLDDMRKAYTQLNNYITKKIRDLNYQSNKLIDYTSSGIYTSIISMYDYDVVNSGVITNLNTDTLYGQLTLAEDYSWSKITRYTDHLGNQKATPDVKISVGPSGSQTVREHDNDAYNCLDNLNHTLWIENTTYEDQMITLTLPKSLKPKINTLKLDFFPQYSCIIKKIEYYSIKGFWEPLSNYDSDGKSIKLHFSPYDYADQIRITIRPISENDPIIGIGNIDLYLTNYMNNGSAIFKFPEVEKLTITSLDDLVIDHYIDNYSVSNQFNTINPLRVYLDIDGDEYEIPYNVINGSNDLNLDVGTITEKVIKVRFEITEVNLTTPVVKGAVLSYTV